MLSGIIEFLTSERVKHIDLKYNNPGIRKSVIMLIVVIFSCISCNKALFDAGEIKTREIILSQPFSFVEVQSIFNIVIVQDTINKVMVTCGDKLQSSVSVEVENDSLTLKNSASFNWTRDYQKIELEVHLSTFPRIDIHQPVSLKTKGVFKGNNFTLIDFGKVSEVDINVDVNSCGIYMSSDNYGYFKVRGKAQSADLWGWGSAYVIADSLIAQNCHVLHRGMADVRVNVTHQLDVDIEFTGNVYYAGNPTTIIIEKQSSSGRLIKEQ